MLFKSEIKSPPVLRIKFLFFLAGFILLAGANVRGQEEVLRVNTELAAFEVTITDKDGKPVRGLEAKDFKIIEDGAERQADFFEPLRQNQEGRPLAVVFALDVSGSMTTDELLRLRAALETCVKRLADYNSYFSIMTFGMQVKTIQSFTNKPEKLEKSFAKILSDQDGLSTHAYDATDDAIRQLVKKAPSTSQKKLMKRAVVLITDGFPVGDTVSPKTVIERANAAETSVYTVILPSFSRVQGNKKPLPTPLEVSGLIEKTGGRSFYANEKDFEPLFKSLAEEITSSYVLAFYPTEEKRTDGKFHKVTIEAPPGYRIKQNRAGYQIK
jgi:VWFA-related protein